MTGVRRRRGMTYGRRRKKLPKLKRRMAKTITPMNGMILRARKIL
jgi:hypothetical protein